MNTVLLTEILGLPVSEKLELIERLWESISPEDDASEVSAEEKKMLDERWDKYASYPGSALTLQELKAAVSARLK